MEPRRHINQALAQQQYQNYMNAVPYFYGAPPYQYPPYFPYLQQAPTFSIPHQPLPYQIPLYNPTTSMLPFPYPKFLPRKSSKSKHKPAEEEEEVKVESKSETESETESTTSEESKEKVDQFKCGECKYTTPYRSFFDRHVRTHLKKYKCDQCDYKSSEYAKMVEHVRIHTGEKPFKASFHTFPPRYVLYSRFVMK